MDQPGFSIGVQLTWILVVVAGVTIWMVASPLQRYHYFSTLEDPVSHRTVTCSATSSLSEAMTLTAICEGACREKGFRVVKSNLDTVIDWTYPPPWHKRQNIKYIPMACRP